MTNEQIRNTDAYKLIYEIYLYSLQKGMRKANGDVAKLDIMDITKTTENITLTQQASDILNKFSPEEIQAIVLRACEDLTVYLFGDSQN